LSQNQLHTAPFSGVPTTAIQKSTLPMGFIVLVIFAFLRPITLTFVGIEAFGFSAFEIFGIIISYMLLFPVLLNFRRLRLDKITLLSIYFCLYCLVSILWGSSVTVTARVILPFIVFFAARMYITEPKLIRVILITLVIGYILPIIKSVYSIILGQSVGAVSYWTNIQRFEGAFGKIHVLGYAMLFFIFISCLLNRVCQPTGKFTKFWLFVFQVFAIYCLYKSYLRTAFVGLIIFWVLYLWGANKKRFFLALIACAVIALLSYQKIENIIWQTGGHAEIGYHNLDAASSGRLYIWGHNIKLFLDSSLPQQLLGRGLGCESKRVVGTEDDVWQPHNNYLNLLMSLGAFGLIIYLTLLIILLWDIYTCDLEKGYKFLFGGIIVSVIVMNFLSNAVIFRIELSQYFWLFMAFFYFEKEKARDGQLLNTELG
jgi:O-antigen ligase